MSYKALYRTYRPQTFADVTGQDVVVKTLQNAIKNNKISHAYLFSGPRGTGKTSIARIFAKALNCSDLQINEPCDKCVSCKEISLGSNPDVIEIDAASNNGVDEIRDIRDKVKFLPSGSKYKVYIIDEVHMLSGGAFNALLKTLEEPPKHAVFILATTEPQKLPATIISRCQRYEFKALSITEISERLKAICELENVNITDEALNTISESAEGAMRDALSMLDQAISYGNKEIDVDDITGVTGSLSFDKVIQLTNSIENKDVHHTLETFNDLIASGKEVSKIINSLLVFYRDALLYKSVGENGFSKYIFTKEQFQNFASNISIQKIMYFIDILCDVQSKIKYSTTPNIFLEITLIKMCNVSVEDLDLMKRVASLEDKINNIGSIEYSGEPVTVDNEKVNTLEIRINQIVNELNRLEIRKQLEKIDELKMTVNNIVNTSNGEANREIKNELQYLKDKIDELDLFVNKEDASSSDDVLEKIKELEDKMNGGSTPSSNVDLSGVYNRIEKLEKQEYRGNSDNYNPQIDDIQEKIDSIMDDINNLKELSINNQNDNYEHNVYNGDLSEISDKLMFLEKRMYQIIAGELSTKKAVKKEPKKNSGQIMLFGDEILSVSDFEQSKENFDFGELQKPEEEIQDEDIIVNIVQEEKEIVEESFDEENNISNEQFDIENSDFEQENESKETAEEAIEDDQMFDIDEENIEQETESEEIIEDITEDVELFDTQEENIELETESKEAIEEVIEETVEEAVGLFETPTISVEQEVNDKVEDENVSRYFDVDKGHEVIKKQNSTLVIAEKPVVKSTGSVVTDIIELESEEESKPVQEQVINNDVEEEKVEEQPVVLQQPIIKDKFSKYDIKDIEQILHDSRATESRNDKVRIEQVWKNMSFGARPEQLSIIETLQEGKVVAVGNKEFILVFPNVSLCNIVMRRKFKDIAVRILYNLLGDTYDYIALPVDVWSDKSVEYKQQYQIGIKYPTLKPLNIPGLEISTKDEYQSDADKAIDRTIQLFGEDNVEID